MQKKSSHTRKFTPRSDDRRSKPAPSEPAELHSDEVRLHKFLADQGIASRRKSEELIKEGRVQVNGETVKVMGTRIDPKRDRVGVDGRAIKPPLRQQMCYYILNKPRGFLVTADDPEGRKTIFELVSHIRERLIAVGRLDRNSEGLLLLTNDGELAYRLTHPRFEVEKEYEVRVAGTLTHTQMEQLRGGLELEDGVTGRAEVNILETDERGTRFSVVIKEGKKRQVRRMVEAIGHEVKRLMRIREGSLKLGALNPGKCRKLTPQEVTYLRREAGLS